MEQAEAAKTFTPLEVALKLKADYSHGLMDHNTKALDEVCALCWRVEKSNLRTEEFLDVCADMITKHLGIASVAIAVRDRDKAYRYKVVTGVDKEAVEGMKRIAYTREQLNDDKTYPGHEISPHTKVYLSEDHPYAKDEEFSYRRPGLIGMRRRAVNDSLEADYIDFFFYGPDKEVLGWIETSGTRMRKLPDPATIRWIELIAFIIGQTLQLRKQF